jgi:hypothetical protein
MLHQCILILVLQTVIPSTCQPTPDICKKHVEQHNIQLSHDQLFNWLNILQNRRNELWGFQHEAELSVAELHTVQNLARFQSTALIIKKYISALCDFLSYVRKTLDFLSSHNMTHVLDIPWVSNLFVVEQWESEVKEKGILLYHLDQIVEVTRTEQFLYDYIQPVTYAIIFTVGFASNGLLFMIFILHKEVRTTRNCLIVNLVVADLLSLVINLPLTHIYLITKFKDTGIAVCQLFYIGRFLVLGSGIYSITFLAIDRYLLFTIILKQQSGRCQLSKRITSLYIIITWVVSITFAVPSASYTIKLRDGSCVLSDGVSLFILYCVTYCVVPVCIVPVLSIVSAHHLQKSANEMPGEGLSTQRRARNRGARMMRTLAIVSVLSYVPHLLLCALNALNLIQELNKVVQVYLEFITYCFIFGNVILNPLTLYITSASFRNLVNRHLLQCWRFCRQTPSQINNSNVNSQQITRISHIS